jgi:hypothetical protein
MKRDKFGEECGGVGDDGGAFLGVTSDTRFNSGLPAFDDDISVFIFPHFHNPSSTTMSLLQ